MKFFHFTSVFILKSTMSCLVFLLTAYLGAAPIVSNLTAEQRTDAYKKVDIRFNIVHNLPVTVTLQVSNDNGVTWNFPCSLVTGDVGPNIYPGNGKHIVWDVLAEHPNIIFDDVKFKVVADDGVVDITTGLIAHYPFSGNAIDASGNGNNGWVVGAVLSADRYGNPSSAYYFDGNDYINIGQLPQLQGAQGITVSCWVKKTSSNRYDGFVGKWYTTPNSINNVFLLYNGENGYASYCNASNFLNKGAFAVQYRNTSSGATGVSGTSVIQPDTWTHIVGVWCSVDGRSVIYKNGLLDNERIETQSINTPLFYNTSYPALIGNWGYLWGLSYYMIGYIDDVRIYNRALTSVEITQLYNN